MSEKINHFRMSLLFVSGAFFATSIQFEHAGICNESDNNICTINVCVFFGTMKIIWF